MEVLSVLLLLYSWSKGENMEDIEMLFGSGVEGNWLLAGPAVSMLPTLLPQTYEYVLEDPQSDCIDGIPPLSSCLPRASLLHQRT